ncbi:MAG: deoxyribose-phosphate aldolase [Planctomycetaceae bacterium]|jgi:deoxyribose-phosphate aldolase|nr:deoxyribose-phosphate aldolase [Planctomycetaceae bacterium]
MMSPQQLAMMIDVSAVRSDSNWNDVQNTAALARQWHCAAAFSLPAFTQELVGLLEGVTDTAAGGVVGFPSGADTTATKIFQAKELTRFGCTEIDMVMNIGQFLSEQFTKVETDIRSVKQVIGSLPLKVILECNYLSTDQIKRASELVVRAGADWVKTGTGWVSGGTTVEQVQLIKQTIGNAARVKAAGGVSNLKILLELHNAGAERFGIGYKKASEILTETI